MLKKKLAFPLLAATILMGTTVYASGTSSATIAYYDTSARGSSVQMKGTVYVSGQNQAMSTDKLYVEVYKQNGIGFPDTNQFSQELSAGAAITNFTFTASDALHYAWLDPAGASYYGCVGSMSAKN